MGRSTNEPLSYTKSDLAGGSESLLQKLGSNKHFTARRKRCAVYSTPNPYVCPSVYHTPVLCPNEGTHAPEGCGLHHRVVSLVFTRTWLRYVRVFAVVIPSVCLSSVTLVHPTRRVEAFGKISSPLCTLAILWPPCKILRISSKGNPSVGGVKRKRGIKIERFWTYRRLYLMNDTR